MDNQTLINTAFALIGGLGGWILKNMQASVTSLQKADIVLTDKLQKIEVLVAGKYVTREDLASTTNALFAKLDRIESKLDHKVDKP